VTVTARDQHLSERVRAALSERGIHPIGELAGHNVALIFTSNVVSGAQTQYTEGWALHDAHRPFVLPRWHAWATVQDNAGAHVVDITPGWFDDPNALYAPVYQYRIADALKHGMLPIHGEGPTWMHHPMEWPNAPGGTIHVTAFEPSGAALPPIR
jgi:hypothetical protein